MSEQGFVPDGFAAPVAPSGAGYRLEPLGPQHNEADHAAWTSSIAHIRATPGFDGEWPPVDGMSLEANLADLQRHADDFAARRGFTYTVLDDAGVVVGCVYIYPSRTEDGTADGTEDGTAKVSSWVSADRADLDGPLHDAVAAWLAADWPFKRVRYRDAAE
ncbi:N-acetyltransferase [Yinghuangia seranimata]|uniref:N-acetyltransferase n=1 Tax=Yinghuangia seranimata TaxID=408067 RepID=UPI00248BFBE9|nr:N-acetyltransferase [Yinghuangia seranimata]MDI2131116.1 N-acetyltransferase [Yinghuangia seranimata]